MLGWVWEGEGAAVEERIEVEVDGGCYGERKEEKEKTREERARGHWGQRMDGEDR